MKQLNPLQEKVQQSL